MTNADFREQAESIASTYGLKNLDDLSFATLESICHEYRDLVEQMLDYISYNESTDKKVEQKLFRATRGVFKYVTTSRSRGYTCYTSSKNKFVQVGYLDINNNIVFDEIKRPAVNELEEGIITRFLPGFHVRGYRSCEEYIPSLTLPSPVTKEIREVISTTVIEYKPSSYGTNNEQIYSVIGFLNDNNELIQYSQIVEE